MKTAPLTSMALVLSLTFGLTACGQDEPRRILSRKGASAVSTPIQDPQPAFADRPLPLRPRQSQTTKSSADSFPMFGSMVTVTSSLAIVLGLFAGLVWLTRKYGGRTMQQRALPSSFLEPLGSSPIDARTRVVLVRCGRRVLVLAHGPTGYQPLTEITDPDEVQELTALCAGGSKQEFAATLKSIERERVEHGFVGTTTPAQTPPERSRLFASA